MFPLGPDEVGILFRGNIESGVQKCKNHTNQFWVIYLIKCTTLALSPKVRDDSADRYEQILRDVSINHQSYLFTGAALGHIGSCPSHLYLTLQVPSDQ